MAWTIAEPLCRFRTLMLEESDGEKHRWKFKYAKKLRYIGRDDWGGLCHNGRRTIELSTTVNLRREIETRVHEVAHATCPDLSEDAVERLERNVCEVLAAAGVIPTRRKRQKR